MFNPRPTLIFSLKFDNQFSTLGSDFYTQQAALPLADAKIVAWSQSTADLLGINAKQQHDPHFVDWVSGNVQLEGSKPLAMVYSGHQFGGYSPQLGDGRGLLLGEINSPPHHNSADQSGHWDIHLKGAGKTPYSRFGDGRAVLRSSIREFLCSEALAALGVPSTRALCITSSSEAVWRESVEYAAGLIRVAKTHIRFGSFEYFSHSNQHLQLRQLADFVIHQYLPHLANNPDPYGDMFEHVVKATAKLIAHWQTLGFAHGVLNTDNMSILGDTLDFGPFGFMEAYQPGFICNHSDPDGRYAFNKQPQIGLWNCNALAQALLPLVKESRLKQALHTYEPHFQHHLHHMSNAKLGLSAIESEDENIMASLLKLMEYQGVDFSRFFRALSHWQQHGEDQQLILFFSNDPSPFKHWLELYQQRLEREDNNREQRAAQMLATNPKFILRNYMAEVAIRRACETEDFSEIARLLNLLSSPFDEHPDQQHYADVPPPWAAGVAVSCSS